MSDQHYLLIPPRGLLEIFIGEPISVETTLAAHGGEGRLISLDVENNGEKIVRVSWFFDSLLPVNSRAREGLEHLGNIHLIFTGPVLFYEADEARLGEVVELLSMRGA